MCIDIFTDGACSGNPGPGGWASIMVHKGKQKILKGNSKNTTNNRMELNAVVESLKYFSVSLCKSKKVFNLRIFSDSAYVVNSVNKCWVRKWEYNDWKNAKGEDVKNVDLWKQFLSAMKTLNAKGFSVEFVKVKGHSGNELNEKVDSICRAESKIAKGR